MKVEKRLSEIIAEHVTKEGTFHEEQLLYPLDPFAQGRCTFEGYFPDSRRFIVEVDSKRNKELSPHSPRMYVQILPSEDTPLTLAFVELLKRGILEDVVIMREKNGAVSDVFYPLLNEARKNCVRLYSGQLMEIANALGVKQD